MAGFKLRANKMLTSKVKSAYSDIRARCLLTLLKKRLLPVEQMLCNSDSRGTKDQFIIAKIVKQIVKKVESLSMAWINYIKLYDTIPH